MATAVKEYNHGQQYETVDGGRFYARSLKEAEEIAEKRFHSKLKPGQTHWVSPAPAKTTETAEQIYLRRQLEVAAFKDTPAEASVPGEDDYARRQRQVEQAKR